MKKGKKTVEVVYLITSDSGVEPATLAAWIRSHWEIENKLRWVRDVTYREDGSLVRTGNATRLMASLHSLAISLPIPGRGTHRETRAAEGCALA
jgi:predicted transposase YbfD/YdcC